jgi:sugar transferase (PEP-CTERM/EpsH1 system associated)
MRRLKICHVLYGLGIGGIETLTVKLVNRMDRSRFEHLILCLTPADDLVSEIEPGAARIVLLNKREGSDLKILPEIARILAAERPDVVHTRNWTTFMEGILPSLATLVRGRVHSFDGLNADNLGVEPARRIWAQRILIRTVQRVVARSEAMRDSMCAQLKIDPRQVQLIADGIDLERYDRPVDRDAVRDRFGLSPADHVTGIVARLDPVKDHATLFRAFDRVARTAKDMKLLVVGGGPIEADLRAMAASLPVGDRIVFTGPQLDVPALYRAMDVYAQPSLYEGVSGSILEAMAARLPVVSTRTGGTVDIVKEGVTGALIDVGDDRALAERLADLYRDRARARTLAEAGRTFVENHYSLARVIAQYSRVYQEACGQAGSA